MSSIAKPRAVVDDRLLAPARFSRKEVARATRTAVELGRPLKQSEVGDLIRPYRLAALSSPVCNGREASWALIVAPHVVRELIASGRLPAKRMDKEAGRWVWEIATADVLKIAEALA